MKAKKIQFTALACVSVATGILGAVAAAPYLTSQEDARSRLSPMWAHNYHSLGEMVKDADAVVLGTVTATRPGRTVLTSNGAGTLPFTLVDVSVERALRGEVADVVTLEQTGGRVDDVAYDLDGDGGPYAAGDRVLLFLKAQPDGEYYYVAHPMGRFAVNDDGIAAVLHDHPVAQSLDRRSVEGAIQMIDSVE